MLADWCPGYLSTFINLLFLLYTTHRVIYAMYCCYCDSTQEYHVVHYKIIISCCYCCLYSSRVSYGLLRGLGNIT